MRRALELARDGIDPDVRGAADRAISERVGASEEFRAADAVLCYLSFGFEVETRGIIARAWERGVPVALPRCVPGRALRWYRADGLDGLQRAPRGMLEPAADPARELDPAAFTHPLAIVPGLAFDRRGFRLGYGGGFYDCFLAGFPGASIGLCRAACLVDDFAALGARDAWDRPVDAVATERETLWRSAR